MYLIEDEDDATTTLQKSEVGLIISLSLGGSSLLIMIVIGCIFLKRKKMNHEKIVDM